MSRERCARNVGVGVVLLGIAFAIASPRAARADDGLTTIDPPGGGQIVYGTLTGTRSLQAAVVYMLHAVHAHFGERPQIGKLIRARDGHSIAALFTVDDHRAHGGGKPIAGVVIASMPDGNGPAVAAIYDESTRFRTTGGAMMQTLLATWRAAAGGGDTEPESLEFATDGDRSAGISLPAGWRLTGVGGGRLSAQGPNGEMLDRGALFHRIHDQGIPRTGDLFDSYIAVSNEDRRKQRLSVGSYSHVNERTATPARLESRAIFAEFEVDFHDGKGPRTGSARIAAIYPRGVPMWEMSVDVSNLPTTVADEASMLAAINASFTQDGALLKKQAEARLHKTQHEVVDHKAWMAAHLKALDAHQRTFDAHMDNLDRYGKSFQNYIFDRSQLQDNDRHERGTINDGDADALVKADPDRFQIVQQQDFVKGVDY